MRRPAGEATTPTPVPETAVEEEAPEEEAVAVEEEAPEEEAAQVSVGAGEMPQCTIEGATPLPGGTLRITAYEPASYDAMGGTRPLRGRIYPELHTPDAYAGRLLRLA